MHYLHLVGGRSEDAGGAGATQKKEAPQILGGGGHFVTFSPLEGDSRGHIFFNMEAPCVA